jgi:hypothetical protein
VAWKKSVSDLDPVRIYQPGGIGLGANWLAQFLLEVLGDRYADSAIQDRPSISWIVISAFSP